MGRTIRDLLYFDFEKAASIHSQLEGGLLESTSTTHDSGKDKRFGGALRIPQIAEGTVGLGSANKVSTLETKSLHHDLLTRIENQLSELGLVVDVCEEVASETPSPETIREAIGETPYLRVSGSSVIEDYQGIVSISERFNDLVKFLALPGISKNEDYVALRGQIEEAHNRLAAAQERNKQNIEAAKLKKLEASLDHMIERQSNAVDEHILEGVRLWIKTFMPGRINFRVYPFEACPSFQVLCNLKRDCFVDQDLEHLLYGYGNRPNVPLGLFGLVTSRPQPGNPGFDPLAEFKDMSEKDEHIALEESFRSMFTAMDELGAFMRYSRYPNITVHPIAVYRQFDVAGESRVE